MKYLFLTADKYPPQRVDIRVLFGEQMMQRGHEIDWVMQSNLPQRGVTIVSYAGGRAWVGGSWAGDSFFAKGMRRIQALLQSFRVVPLALRNRYDFIQVKDRFFGALVALLAARLSRTRFVYWLAYPFPESWIYDADMRTTRFPFVSRVRGHAASFLLYRVILPSADFVFVQSEQMKLDIAANGIAPAKMTAVPMGVSESLLSQETIGPSPSARLPIVLYVGTMIRVRRLEFILEVFRQVLASVPAARLYMVGGETDADIEYLKAESKRLGIEAAVVFTGMLPQQEAVKWMRSASVCVSPFYPTPILCSTSPTKLVEYWSQAKAVVANDHPEQSKAITESGGGICTPYETAPFAAAIVRLLTDPQLALEMGRLGRRYVETHRTYPHIADTVEMRYRKIVASR